MICQKELPIWWLVNHRQPTWWQGLASCLVYKEITQPPWSYKSKWKLSQ